MNKVVNYSNVRLILEKYYQGLTSIEEENSLREFFQNNEISSDLRVDKELLCSFVSMETSGVEELNASVRNAILQGLEIKTEKRKSLIMTASWIGAAASIVLVVALGWFLIKENKSNVYVDTYDDPYLALQHTREILTMVSGKMNFAMQELKTISALDNSLHKLEPLEQVTNQFKKISGLERICKPIYYQSDTLLISY